MYCVCAGMCVGVCGSVCVCVCVRVLCAVSVCLLRDISTNLQRDLAWDQVVLEAVDAVLGLDVDDMTKAVGRMQGLVDRVAAQVRGWRVPCLEC